MPGDCYRDPGLAATRRFLDFFGPNRIMIAGGDDEGRNPFPVSWRDDSRVLEKLPELGEETTGARPGPAMESAPDFLASRLKAAAGQVSIVATWSSFEDRPMTGSKMGRGGPCRRYPHVSEHVGSAAFP